MRRRSLIFSILIGVVILLVCAQVYIFSARPQSSSAQPTDQPGNIQATEPAPSEAPNAQDPTHVPLPAIPERRRLTIEFPPKMRAGDSDIVRLTLEVDDLGNITPTAQIGGNVITGQVIEIPNLYETHNVIAESRFDIAGMEVRPAELVSEALSPRQSITFRWSIHPSDVGVYQGTIWLYLRFVEKSSGAESRKTVSAQIVEIEVANLWGLSGNWARITGIVGSVVGTVIGFPFLEEILKFIFKKRKAKSANL
jgi:hypothetical protein